MQPLCQTCIHLNVAVFGLFHAILESIRKNSIYGATPTVGLDADHFFWRVMRLKKGRGNSIPLSAEIGFLYQLDTITPRLTNWLSAELL
jgi:hypothetical protein